jgi:hypothetical protein
MEKSDYKEIKSIEYPNTGCPTADMHHYGNTMDSWRFEQVMENGEMAGISWIAVFKNDKKVAQIKQSVCNIYFK